MDDYIQVITTIDREEAAADIARLLVETRLAACVQVAGPITSTYRWKGQVETSREWQCVAKTRRELYQRVEEAIRQAHSYDEPEIVAVPLAAGSPSYLAWLDGQLIQP
jgi:periplasmic divalent cation tolerance protein